MTFNIRYNQKMCAKPKTVLFDLVF